MIQTDIPAHRRLKSNAYANITVQWIARVIFLVSAFVAFKGLAAQMMIVAGLLMYETSRALSFAAMIEKTDDQSLKLWANELAWRNAFAEIQRNPQQDWSAVIREQTQAAWVDIGQAQTDSAALGKGMSYWLSVPLKVVWIIFCTIVEVVIAGLLAAVIA